MRPDIRWQALLAMAGLALALMFLSVQSQSAALCSVTVPAAGGTFVEGVVGRPRFLNPLLSDPYPVDRQLNALIYEGLVSYDELGEVRPGLAESWAVSDDGLTFTFTLREDATWHDGEPITADDVAFTYGLLQHEDFPAPDHLRNLWQSVTITPIDERQIQFTLPQAYAPFPEAVTRGILPAHLLEDVPPAEFAAADFFRAPIGSGPFIVEADPDWRASDHLRLTPNPEFWREGTQLDAIEFRFLPDADSLLDAFRASNVHAANGLPPMMTPDVAAIEGSRLFTSIASRYSALYFNLSDTGVAALKSKEVRQALAYGLDRAGLVDGVLNGQGVVFEGPYLPDTWPYRPDLLTSYSYQPETAAALLDTAGWTRGQDGARAREGAPLALRLVALDQPEHRAVAEEVARQWAESGIDVRLTLLPGIDELRQTLAGRNYDVALVEIAPPSDPDLYDFWSQEATVRGQNFAGWNNRRASEALEAGRQLFTPAERAPFYEAFLRQFDADLPALTLYQHVTTYALHDTVQGAEIGRVWHPADRYATLASWFINYREVAVACSPDAPN